jgi:hypothetical protein
LVLGNGFEATRVIGVVEGRKGCGQEEKQWSGCLAWDSVRSQWERVPSLRAVANNAACGRHLITESGTFLVIAPDSGKITAVRDHTEVGMTRIHLTYPFVEARIRSCPP